VSVAAQHVGERLTRPDSFAGSRQPVPGRRGRRRIARPPPRGHRRCRLRVVSRTSPPRRHGFPGSRGGCLAFVLLPPPLHQWGQNPRVGACSRSLTDRRSRRSALLPVGTPQAVGLALLRPALEELVQHGDAPTAPGSHDRLSTNLPQDQGQAASEGGKTDVVPRHRRPPATQCVCGCRRGDPWARYLRWRYLGAC
jgi:hypothetical protein